MSIYNFQQGLRARLARMANEHLAMQDAIMDLPSAEVYDACMRLEAHSIEMSQLAKRLEENTESECLSQRRRGAEGEVGGSENALPLTPHPLRFPDPEVA